MKVGKQKRKNMKTVRKGKPEVQANFCYCPL